MQKDITQILKTCSDLESDVAEIYRKFAEIFPEAAELWLGLASEEDGHASVLQIAYKYAELGKVPDVVPPELLTNLEGTLEMVAAVNNEIEGGKLTLREALGMSLNLEQTVHEDYLHGLMTIKAGSDVVERLQRIATETESHVKRIEDFIRKIS